MTILKVQMDSPESGEHSKYLDSMSEVSKTNSQIHFQNLYFPHNPFFVRTKIAKPREKKGFCGKYNF